MDSFRTAVATACCYISSSVAVHRSTLLQLLFAAIVAVTQLTNAVFMVVQLCNRDEGEGRGEVVMALKEREDYC